MQHDQKTDSPPNAVFASPLKEVVRMKRDLELDRLTWKWLNRRE